MVQNNSVNGTLVNGERADLKVLEEGDRIQVGAESLFEVSYEASRRKKPTEPAESGEGGGLPLKQILLYGGIGIYLLAMVGLVVFLSSRDAAPVSHAIQQGDVAYVVDSTREFLLAGGGTEMALDARRLPNVDRAMSLEFYELKALVDAGAPENEIEPLVTSITGSIEQHMFRTWQYEQRLQLQPAVDELEKVFSLVPDIRSPSADYALQKISEIRARMNDG